MQMRVMNCVILLLVLAVPGICSAEPERTIAAVVFEGVTAFGAEQLLPLYADSLGKAAGAQQQNQLQARTRSLYLRRGFLAPAVSVAAHPDNANIIRIRVKEPEIDSFRLAGGLARQRAAVRERVPPLLGWRPVSQKDLARFARAVELAVGVGLKTRTEETSPGYHRAFISIAPKIRGELTYSAEGSQRLGQHMAGGSLSVYGPGAGIRDIYVSATHTLESDGYRNLGTGLSFAPSERDRLYIDFSTARAVPQDESLKPDKVYKRIWSRLKWRRDLIDAGQFTLAVDGALILRDYTRQRGDETEIDERLRMAEARALAYVKSTNSTSRVSLSARAGVDSMGAQREGTRADGTLDLAFQLLAARYTLWHGLPADFSLKLDLAGQYSTDNLPYSQRFSAGGNRYIRAYEPGEFSGDSGVGSKLELRRGFQSDRWLSSVRWVPYLYYGIATAHENDSRERASAAATGFGLRALASRASAYIELGKPLTTKSEYKNTDPRLTGRLTVRF